AGLQPVAAGEEGELFVGGARLARGYLGRPGLTAAAFVPDPFSEVPGARMYLTGDRVRWEECESAKVRKCESADSSETTLALSHSRTFALQFLGRLDDQVKVGGFRVEPGEVEAVLAGHPDVVEAAVVARDDGTGRVRLVGYVVPRPGAAVGEGALRRWLRGRLPGYMVPSAIVTLDALPLSAHGKVDRRALPAPAALLPLDAEYRAPAAGTEQSVAEIWSEVLGVERVGAGDDFFDLGGHSLLGMQVLSRVRQRLGVELPVRAVFEAPTPAGLAARIDAAGGAPAAAPPPPLRPMRRDGPLPLSFAQQRLWFLHQMEPESPFYNIPAAVRLTGALDADALRRALREVVRRHEALRTTFLAGAEGSVQVVHPAPDDFPLPLADLRALGRAEAEAEARRLAAVEAATPFDLRHDPMLRALLVRVAGDEHLLVLNLHHVAGDGWSIGVLFREIAELYGAFRAGVPSPLDDLPVQYADFAVWQREWLGDGRLEEQLAYWRGRLAGAPAVLELPADRPRPWPRSYRGEVLPFDVPDRVAARLRELARAEDATLFMVLLAAFDLLLHRLSGHEEVVVGSPIAGRVRGEVEGLIGFFVNTMALRVDLSGDPSFRALVRRVREVTLEAYAHQDLPFERVVEEVQPERTLGHNPLFQHVFVLQNVEMDPVRLPGLELALEDVDSGTSKFDTLLEMREEGGRLRARLEYSTELWDRASAERMAGLFLRLLESVTADPETSASRAVRADARERRLLVEEWNRTAVDYPRDASIPAVFARVAEAGPERIALSWDGGRMTYAELHERSSRLARRLLRLGVAADEPVALLCERSAEMVVAQLGILKAGGCYVPLNPKYPRGRVRMMVEDCGARVLVAQPALEAAIPDLPLTGVRLDADGAEVAGESDADPRLPLPADAAAYIMYTSGSTGRPKGVVVPHRGILRLVLGADFADLGPEEVFLQLSAVTFDVSTLEIWGPLLNGGRVALYPPELPDPAELGRFLRRHGVTSAWLTAGLFHQVVDAHLDALSGLRQLLAGGDV
ncbi:MAG TPA: condensation domain-containing protein, partial [Longimicrobium sp.]|nr:condensation domain-containing protein [Longimicrobium sp.]